MKDQFSGYYRPTDSDIERVWNEGAIVFDSSSLLNFYRYSEETCKSLFKVITHFEERLWIPYQVASEYHRNRLTVIKESEKLYTECSLSVKKLLATLESTRQHPFVATPLLHKTQNSLNELLKDIDKRAKEIASKYDTDEYYEKIAQLYMNRVGPPPDASQAESLLSEAKRRCEAKIPPGFKDADKDGSKKYGDAVLWLQLLEHMKDKKQPVLLVTDDGKEDWWNSANGKTIGPLPELIDEYKRVAGDLFLLYRPDRFLKQASKFTGIQLSEDVIEEAKAATRSKHEHVMLRVSAGKREWCNEMVASASRHLNTLGKLHRVYRSRQTAYWLDYDEIINDTELVDKLSKYCRLYPRCINWLLEYYMGMQNGRSAMIAYIRDATDTVTAELLIRLARMRINFIRMLEYCNSEEQSE